MERLKKPSDVGVSVATAPCVVRGVFAGIPVQSVPIGFRVSCIVFVRQPVFASVEKDCSHWFETSIVNRTRTRDLLLPVGFYSVVPNSANLHS